MPIKNYSTTKDPIDTIAEIEKILVKHGCKGISKDYEDGIPIAVYFTFLINNYPVNFKLDARQKATLKILEEDKGVPKSMKTEEQALKVSWRIIKDWIDSQLAYIQTGQVTFEELFLPKAVDKSGKTFYERLEEGGNIKMLTGETDSEYESE